MTDAVRRLADVAKEAALAIEAAGVVYDALVAAIIAVESESTQVGQGRGAHHFRTTCAHCGDSTVAGRCQRRFIKHARTCFLDCEKDCAEQIGCDASRAERMGNPVRR